MPRQIAELHARFLSDQEFLDWTDRHAPSLSDLADLEGTFLTQPRDVWLPDTLRLK